MKKQMILTVLVSLCLALPALAAGPGTQAVDALETFTQGCDQELSTFCKDVTPGEGRILACLYAFQDKVSLRCERALYDSLGQLDMALTNLDYAVGECSVDLETVCADGEAGEGRLLDCLVKNEAKVSKRCTAALKDVGYTK